MIEKRPLILSLFEETSHFIPSQEVQERFEVISRPFPVDSLDHESLIAIVIEQNTFDETSIEPLRQLYALGKNILVILFAQEVSRETLHSLSLMFHTLEFPQALLQENSARVCHEIFPILTRHWEDMRYLEALKLRSHHNGFVDSLNIVAHQWRQPINLISMEAINLSIQSSLADSVDSVSILKSTDIISEQTQRMADILKSVLNMGKTHRGKEPFSINETLERIKLFFHDQLKRHHIDLHILSLEEDRLLYGYQTDIEEVLVNLISNAKDAFGTRITYLNKNISIESDFQDNLLSFIVKDNAGGVPEEIRQKIFEPHFSTKGEGEGFGIGLHVAQLIIKQEFHGSLRLQVEEDETHFIITIPYVDPSHRTFINA